MNKRRTLLTPPPRSDDMKTFLIYYIYTGTSAVVPSTYNSILNELNSFLHENDKKDIPEPFTVVLYYEFSYSSHQYKYPQSIQVNPNNENQFIIGADDNEVTYWYDESNSVWKMSWPA